MKATLFSADFVRTNSNDLRLLEVNTGTSIQQHLADSKLDFTDLISVITSNSITNVHVLYQHVSKPIADRFEDQLTAAAPSVEFNRVVQADQAIYATSVTDEDDRLILRIAYDHAAVFDSEYAARDLNIYRLFIDNDASEKIPGIFYSGSDYGQVIDTLETNFNSANIADFTVRKYQAAKGDDLFFYKAGRSSDDSETRMTSIKSELSTGGKNIITNYYKVDDATKASSIRLYQVIYGTALDIVNIGAYEIDALLDYPTSLTIDENVTGNLIDSKHYSEFSVEGINRARGLTTDNKLIKFDGSYDAVAEVTNGDNYKSYFVSGSPDTDSYGTLMEWEDAGDEMPSGSYATGSIMISSTNDTPCNNGIVKVTLGNGKIFRAGGTAVVLIYDSSADAVKYDYLSNITTDDQLFDSNGDKVSISSLDIEITEDSADAQVYQFNLEDTDVYINSGSEIIFHNAPCFIAGTKVLTETGEYAIEDIKVGDKVLTVNHEEDKSELKNVIQTMVTDKKEVVEYTLENGETLTGTPDHPIYVIDKGYSSLDPEASMKDSGIEASQIEVGDKLLHFDGYEVPITKIERLDDLVTVYNLSNVEGNHNFYANGFLVHNRQK
jgi:hypothetical protein